LHSSRPGVGYARLTTFVHYIQCTTFIAAAVNPHTCEKCDGVVVVAAAAAVGLACMRSLTHSLARSYLSSRVAPLPTFDTRDPSRPFFLVCGRGVKGGSRRPSVAIIAGAAWPTARGDDVNRLRKVEWAAAEAEDVAVPEVRPASPLSAWTA